MPERLSASRPWIAAGVLAVVAIATTMYITAQEAGVSPDSTRYLAAAANFASGRGLVHLGEDGGLAPLRLWPPAYPILLSLGNATIVEAWQWGRTLNTLLFGANVVALFLVIRQALGGRWLPALAGSSLFLVSPAVVEIHAWIWSEPVMILCGLLSLLLVDRFLQSRRWLYLFVAGAFAGLSFTTRFAAVAYVVAGGLGLLLFDRNLPFARRLAGWLAYLAIAAGPMLVWSLSAGGGTAEALGRGIQVNERGVAQLGGGLPIVSDWFLPGRIGDPVRTPLTQLVLVVWLAFLLFVLLGRWLPTPRQDRAPRSYLPELLAFFIVTSAALLIGVKLLLSPGVSISPRIFSPGYTALVALTTVCLVLALDRLRAAKDLGRRKIATTTLLEWALALAVLFVGAMNLTRSIAFARKAHAEGLGYGAVAWRTSAIIQFLDDLPPDTVIVSNGPDAVYFLTGRLARMLPPLPGLSEGAPLRPEDVETVTRRVHPGDVLAYFRGITWRPSMTEREIKQAFAVSALIGNEEASVYEVDEVLVATN